MILCAGECLIDMLPRSVDGTSMLEPVAGGAVMNTAVALGRLDIPVEFLSGLSTDQFGKKIAAHLSDSNVGTRFAVQSDRPTTLAFVEFNNGAVSYNFYDENTAGRMVEASDIPVLPQEVQAVFCGGISLINTPAADAYAALVEANADRLVMIDPNIRPAFIGDADAYRTRLTGMLANADIVKTSDEDLAWLFPDATFEQGVAKLLDMGPRVALFTEGAKGASAVRKGQPAVFAASKKVEVVDTVGAGDTFNAGFLASLFDQGVLSKAQVDELTDDQLAAALSFANRCAGLSVTKVGAQPPWRTDVS